jgi:hypothetical protein
MEQNHTRVKWVWERNIYIYIYRERKRERDRRLIVMRPINEIYLLCLYLPQIDTSTSHIIRKTNQFFFLFLRFTLTYFHKIKWKLYLIYLLSSFFHKQ